MSVESFLKSTVKKISDAPCRYRSLLVLVPIIFIFFLVSFSTNHWIQSSAKTTLYDSRTQGLWKYCSRTGSTNCCGYLADVIGSFNHSIPAFVQATRAFMCLGLISLTTVLVLLFIGIFYLQDENGRVCTDFLLFLSLCITVLFLLISVSVYGGSYPNHEWTEEYSISWSLGLCIISLILSPVGAIITCCRSCDSDSYDEY